MNVADVYTLLEQNKNLRGITNWEQLENNGGLQSFGIGLTVLRKLAKKIGRDHHLAQQLWSSHCYDAKVRVINR